MSAQVSTARRVLIVDDSTTIRSLLKVHLMGLSFDFFEASDGEQGLLMLRRTPADLVLLDFNMPHLDGVAFARAVRADADQRVKHVPIVLMSSERRIADLERASLDAGVNAFFPKPVNVDRLRAAVNRLLNGPLA